MDHSQIELIAQYAHILQVGARNMQNFTLLREFGTFANARVVEARHFRHHRGVASVGRVHSRRWNMNVMLCERGIRTFESYTRNTLDISAIPVVQQLAHLPVLADPSHGTGRRDKVTPMARHRSRPAPTD